MNQRRPGMQQVFGPGAAAGGHVGEAHVQRQTPQGRKTEAEMMLSFARYHEQIGSFEVAAEYREKAWALEQRK